MKHLSTDPYRGTRDFLPEEMSVRTQIFEKLFSTVELFGFRRYDGPILEPVSIYEAKSGGEIANEQMYRLKDKKGRQLALRPEMTPSVARIIAGNFNDVTFPARWYSHVNCHRYERPQRGRVREHWQLNVDLFGSDDFTAEAELFELIVALMTALGADASMYAIRVNDRLLVDKALRNHVGLDDATLGPAARAIDAWEKVDAAARTKTLEEAGLDAAQIQRLEELVGFDLEAMCAAAGPEATEASRVARMFREGLLKPPVRFDPLIMRGFDYYTSTVFEVFDTSPDNRRSMFGGGRYDDLAGLFTKHRIPGIGFGMGDVTCWNFLVTHGLLPKPDLGPDVVVFTTREDCTSTVREMSSKLRGAGIRTVLSLEVPSMKKGLKHADKQGAQFVLIIGDEEQAQNAVLMKTLGTGEQKLVPQAEALEAVRAELAK